MKKFLMITIVAFTMVSCAVVDKNTITEGFGQAAEAGNVAGELVSLINGYTEKINAVESVYDLFFISEKCYKEKISFEKNYTKELSTLKNSFAEKTQATNDAIKKAMNEFEAAVNKKAKELADEQDRARKNAQKNR